MSQKDFPPGMTQIRMECTLWDFTFKGESLSGNLWVNETEPITDARAIMASNIPNQYTIEIARRRSGCTFELILLA